MDMTSHSSSYGRAIFHICFKVKYCHKIFTDGSVRNRCQEIFLSVAEKHKFVILEIGFDNDHVHMMVDIGLKSIPEIAKLLKGNSGYRLLKEFPELKKNLFWGSGLWNPSYFFDSIGRDFESTLIYVRNQQYH